MANIAIFSELQKDTVKTVTLEILGKLNQHETTVILLGESSDSLLNSLKEYGATKVVQIDIDNKDYSPEKYTDVLYAYLKDKNFDYVFTGATAMTKDFFPRLAGKFDAGLATDITELEFSSSLEITRPLFAGKCLVKCLNLRTKTTFSNYSP